MSLAAKAKGLLGMTNQAENSQLNSVFRLNSFLIYDSVSCLLSRQFV